MSVQLTINTKPGRRFILAANSSQTIAALSAEVAKRENITVGVTQLATANRILDPSMTVAQAGLATGAELAVSLQAVGG